MRTITSELCWAQLQLLDEELARTWNEKHAAAVQLQRNWWAMKLRLLERRVFTFPAGNFHSAQAAVFAQGPAGSWRAYLAQGVKPKRPSASRSDYALASGEESPHMSLGAHGRPTTEDAG